MKRIVLILLLMSLLTGCGSLVDHTYYDEQEYSEPPMNTQPTEREEEQQTVVSNRNDLRAAVLYRTRNWIEQDVLLIKHYDGDFNQDLSEVLHHATQEDPIGAYAVDYIDAQLVGDTVSGSVQVSIVFRRSAAEINSIITVNSTANALQRIQLALSSYETSLTLRIRNYQQMDFAEKVRDFCLKNPNKVLALPELSAEIYPNSGETRILELHFSYPETREEMRLRLSTVNTLLTSATSYINTGADDFERLALLTRFLTTRFDYQIAEKMPTMPAYELLHDGLAHSLSFAAVFRYECSAANIECWLVSGTKDEQEHYWNIVRIDEVYYHVDLMRNIAQNSEELTLLSTEEILAEGYIFDAQAYPNASGYEMQPQEPTVNSQPQETEPPTQESTEPTESEEPTEESTDEPSETEENN